MEKDNRVGLGRLALLGATLIWGSSFVILKLTLESIPVFWELALRFIGAAALMLLLGAKELKKLDMGYLKQGAIIGVLMFLGYVTQTFGLQYTTPGKNAFLTSTYCVIVPFFCWLIYKKRPDGYNASAALICVVGMALVSLNGDLSLGLGDGLTMLCGIFYALQIIVIDRAVEGRNIVLLTFVELSVAGLLCLCCAPLVSPFPSSVPTSAWLNTAYLCIVCTGVCFLLQGFGQRYTSPQSASIILTLEAVFGTLLSVIFYDELLTGRVVLGFVLIFAAVLISETKLSFLKKPAVKQPL
ncbi:MAG: DMT family transporter [Oscillospiraceae bacterium]